MKLSFDLFHGMRPISCETKQWISGWWYNATGFPIELGTFSNGDRWLLVGSVINRDNLAAALESHPEDQFAKNLFRLDGQFIFIVSAHQNDVVEIFRDRTGIMPLYFHKNYNGLMFSVNLGHIKEFAGNKLSVSPSLFYQWPVYRLIFFPDTPFREIESVSGKHSLLIVDNKVLSNSHPIQIPDSKSYSNLQSASNALGDILSCAVEKRISGFEKIGAWLSGGNDSSLLVALCRKHFGGNIKTIFVTFEDNPRDYGNYAQFVAQKFNTDHVRVELSAKDYVNLWAETINISQSPLCFPGVIGQMAGYKYMTDKVDIMLTGEGADTVFGGPYWAPMLFLSKISGLLPIKLRDALCHLSRRFHADSLINKVIGKSLRAAGTRFEDYLHIEQAVGDKNEVDKVFQIGTWDQAITYRKEQTEGNPLLALFAFHMLYWIPLKVALEMSISMNYGIRPIYPFLDYELMRDSLRLPVRLRYHYSTKKAALKRYCLRYFDRDFVYKPKEGLGVPLSKWFMKPELDPFLNLPLEEKSLKRGWWDEKELRRLIKSHKNGDGDDNSAESIPWITCNLELWARICLEGDSPDLYKI